MNMGMTLATLDQGNIIYSMQEFVTSNTYRPKINDFRAIYNAVRDRTLYVVDCEGSNVGFVVVKHHDNRIVVDDLGIIPEFRNRGVGTGILEMLACPFGGKEPQLEVVIHSKNRAVSLFKRNGFKAVKQIPSYNGTNELGIWMVRIPSSSP